MKKGLIVGGSIAGVVLLGTTLGLGIYFGTRPHDILADDSVQTWGYDDQISSTAAKVNWYMDTDTTVTKGQYGGVAVSAEPTLINNSLYHSMTDDIYILDGVAGSDNGLGYLSSAWVGGYENANFRMLELKSNVDGSWLNPMDDKDRITYSGLIGNEEQDKTYTEEESDVTFVDVSDDSVKNADNYADMAADAKKAYVDKGEIQAIINADDKISKIDGTAITKGTYEKEMAATLNLHLKVPQFVAQAVVDSGIISATPKAIEKPAVGSEFAKYIKNVKDEKFLDDFVLSLAFMDYVAFDSSNIDSINENVIAGTNDKGSGEFEADDWSVMEETYSNLGGSGTLLSAIQDQQKGNSGTYLVKVDGTGTDSGVMKNEVNNFEKDFTTFAGAEVNFKYDLNNGGSGEGWKGVGDNEADLNGVPKPGGADGRADAFLGTQSRFSKDSEPESWGYDDSAAALNNDGVRYTSPDKADGNGVIGYTMGIDLPVFFVKDDMTLKFTVTADTITNKDKIFVDHEGNPVEFNGTEGDVINIKPVGITAEGAKDIYQDGASWTSVIEQGLVTVEIV